MPGEGAFQRGRYRVRTWLRGHEPSWFYDLWPIPKVRRDCLNHEFYNADDVDRCYHCDVGVRARLTIGSLTPEMHAEVMKRG